MNQYQLFSEYITTFYYSNSKTTGFGLKSNSLPKRYRTQTLAAGLFVSDIETISCCSFNPPQYFFTNFLVKNPRKANTRVSAISTFFKKFELLSSWREKKKQKSFKSLFFFFLIVFRPIASQKRRYDKTRRS